METSDKLSIPEQIIYAKINWFINLRWIACFLILSILFVSVYIFDFSLPVGHLLIVVFAIFFYNSIFALITKFILSCKSVKSRFLLIFINSQIILDLIFFTAMLHYSGGVENPFKYIYMFHIIISSKLLSMKNTLLHVTISAVLFNFIAWGEYLGFLEHYSLQGIMIQDNFLFTLQRTFALTFALFVIFYLAEVISTKLRTSWGELEQRNRELIALDKERVFVMQRVSHDLKSPLSAIASLIQLVLNGYTGKINQNQRNILDKAKRRTRELMELVNDILLYARLKKLPDHFVEQKVFNVSKVLKNQTELLNPLARDKNIDFRINIEKGLKVIGEKDSAKEAFTNLIENAIKYTPNNGKVTVNARKNKDNILIKISDTGIGIPKEDQEDVFKEFFRASNVKKTKIEGTGLGMSIVKKIITLMRGKIDLESQENKGTTFYIKLPQA